jgi:hypothetical protein
MFLLFLWEVRREGEEEGEGKRIEESGGKIVERGRRMGKLREGVEDGKEGEGPEKRKLVGGRNGMERRKGGQEEWKEEKNWKKIQVPFFFSRSSLISFNSLTSSSKVSSVGSGTSSSGKIKFSEIGALIFRGKPRPSAGDNRGWISAGDREGVCPPYSSSTSGVRGSPAGREFAGAPGPAPTSGIYISPPSPRLCAARMAFKKTAGKTCRSSQMLRTLLTLAMMSSPHVLWKN